jgi:uncharacterized membrane protein YfcA
MFPEILISIIIISFILEFFDASLGMGYGTTLTPLLFLLGFAPLEVIPAVLFTNAILGVIAAFFHHRFKNVNFHFKSKDTKVTLVLIGLGTIGILIAILLAVRLPEDILRAYLGLVVLIIGVVVLAKHKKKHPFSWKKLIGLSSLAAFNKGMTGGGYGSVIVGGQILSGVDGKNAIGIASLAEGIICIFGVLAYVFIGKGTHLNWTLITPILIGGAISIPIAAYVVNRFHPRRLNFIIGIFNIILGTAILAQLLL